MSNAKNSVKNVLHMENIIMQLGGVVAMDGLTLNVNEYEIMALIGPNGAGKTTTFNCATGAYQPTLGSVSFNGEVILADTFQGKMRRLYGGDVFPTNLTPTRKAPSQITELGTARTLQNIRFFGALAVFENVLIAKHIRAKQNVFSATLYLSRAEEKRMRQEFMALLKTQGLAHLKDEVTFPLPYGLQCRLEIARALATNPSLPLLDEPAADMNSQGTRDLTDFIRKVGGDYHLTTFMVKHHMDLVIRVSDRTHVLDLGKFIARGTPGQIRDSPKVIRAYLGASEDVEGQ